MTTTDDPSVNVQGMVLGFAGSTTTGNEGLENLQAAHVRTIAHNDCAALYPAINENIHYCAEDVQERSNFCLGDQVNYKQLLFTLMKTRKLTQTLLIITKGGAFTTISREVEYLVKTKIMPLIIFSR